MDTTAIVIIALIALVVTIVGSTALILINLRQRKEDPEKDQKSFLMLQNQINQITETINQRLQGQQELLQKQNVSLQQQGTAQQEFLRKMGSDTQKNVQELTTKLTELQETNKQVREFATQLQSLENILKNPKRRGILGEYFLEDLLGDVMPQGSYKMQYSFKDGEIVDAAVFVNDKIIPVDAKFSLEKYNEIQEENDKERRATLEKEFKSDLKARIDETSKYIREDEGTTDFALMFIPAEGIFYNLLMYKVGAVNVSSEDLINYAFQRRVVIVSPNTFYAYLQTILQALRALEVEESAKDIIKRVGILNKHLKNYDDYMVKLGKHLGTSVSSYNKASKEFGKIDKDVLKISGKEVGTEQLLLEKPDTE